MTESDIVSASQCTHARSALTLLYGKAAPQSIQTMSAPCRRNTIAYAAGKMLLLLLPLL